jgi:hypothetical protein
MAAADPGDQVHHDSVEIALRTAAAGRPIAAAVWLLWVGSDRSSRRQAVVRFDAPLVDGRRDCLISWRGLSAPDENARSARGHRPLALADNKGSASATSKVQPPDLGDGAQSGTDTRRHSAALLLTRYMVLSILSVVRGSNTLELQTQVK